MGYPVIPGQTFFKKEWAEAVESDRDIDAAYAYAKATGFPVIVKPNSKSQGKGVTLVHNRSEFYKAMRQIFQVDSVALVQTVVKGQDYRVVVLDDKVISAYERTPLKVTGNGKSTIDELLKQKQKKFLASSRDTRLKLEDPRMVTKLARQNLSLNTILKKGHTIDLLDNANLSAGGDSFDVTKTIHPEFARLAIKLTKDMGLRFCGVDLMIEGGIENEPRKYWVVEINSAPGLDHYVKGGKEQQKIVEDLYLQVLREMEK